MMKMNKNYQILSLFLALVIVMSCIPVFASAQNYTLTDSEKSQIQALRDKQKALDDKIKAAEAKLGELSKDIKKEKEYAQELTRQLDNLNAQIDVLSQTIDTYQGEIDILTEKITANEKIRSDLERDMYSYRQEALDLSQYSEDTYDELLSQLRVMYMTGQTTELEALFDSDSLMTFLLRLELINSIADHDDKLISSIKDSIKGANEAEKLYKIKEEAQKEIIAQLESDSAELVVQQNEVVEAREKLEQTQAEQQALYVQAVDNIDKLDKQSSEYQSLIQVYNEDVDEFENQIDTMIAEFNRQHAAEIAAASSILAANSQEAASREHNSNAANGDLSNTTTRPAYSSTGFIHPLCQYSDAYISSTYGSRRDPITGIVKYHYAIDIACYSGAKNKNVVAAADGRVVTSTWHSMSGYYILISHANNMYTLYAHNNKLLVKKGDYVKQGQVIAKAGSTGYSTGPHVHFEVRVGNQRVNPLNYVKVR